ncbi:hypothetical protein PHAVU_009G234100 [Phaseolus vulgaris]|uniref:Auxin efflux carrier component n=1 Tax=Phaseolus vulgaris TaxID=3885 RepID=V7AYW3_PHAVU|nr:hypothetical protein PHAVU_009G234100g [Phaseolus vulgaris]ESW10744.1 hypothetical protein PHAVU_009G234100g [Phaseolus vulgaris]
MIKGKDVYDVVAVIVPLYVALFLAYGSVRWWKIFTPEQCSGINRFVSVFAVPFLSFHFISNNNPYTMNFRFLAADSLQKVVILVALVLWNSLTKWGSINWTITLFSLSTLPNTLIMGVPLLKAMYGDFTATLMIQIVVFQSVIWYTLLLFMFEYRGAKLLILEKFPDTAGAISSVWVDSNVDSLSDRKILETNAEAGEDGNLRVVVRSMSRSVSIASNLTGIEIHSMESSREPRLKNSNYSATDLHPRGPKRESMLKMHEKSFPRSKSVGYDLVSYPSLKPIGQKETNRNKVLNMFELSSSAISPTSDPNVRHEADNRVGYYEFETMESSKGVDFASETTPSKVVHEDIEIEGLKDPVLGSHHMNENIERDSNRRQEMPRASVMIKLILTMVWRNLMRNPNTYASVSGLVWSLIFFKYFFHLFNCFLTCLFMALQPKIITCGKTQAMISMVIKFLVGPIVMLATSKAMGINGVLLKVAIVQASLPEAIVPFVFAKEYNLHANILSTAVIFGMVAALPVTIIYYVILEF